jgi:Ca2+-binding RTX toxin-like protein
MPGTSPWTRLAGGAATIGLVVSLLGAWAAPVAADATLTAGVVGADSEATNDGGSDDCEEPLTDSASCSVSSSGSRDGASGSASASVGATLGYDDLGFLTSLTTSGVARGRATATETERAYGESSSGAFVSFEVVNTATVIVQGSLRVADNGGSPCSSIRLFDMTQGGTTLDLRAQGSQCGWPGGTFRNLLDEEVRLAAGAYQLSVRAIGGTFVEQGGGSKSSSASFDLDILLRTCDNEYTDGPDLITGTPGRDILCGGPGDDDIFGLGGNDRILGGPGNDTIEGGPGNDDIDAGPGNDRFVDGGPGLDEILGGPGNDGRFTAAGISFTGGDGNDRLFGGDGVNAMSGGPGADSLFGGPDSDFLDGDGGDDTLIGAEGDDSLYGGGGDDEIEGGPGNEVGQQGRLAGIDGGPGNDVLTGGGGDDLMEGRDGADSMDGGNGADKLRGGADDDGLVGGAGRDVLVGGDGPDDLHSRDGVPDDVIGGPGQDGALVDRIDTVSGVEDVTR